jgi:restriction endonuclease Mrr
MMLGKQKGLVKQHSQPHESWSDKKIESILKQFEKQTRIILRNFSNSYRKFQYRKRAKRNQSKMIHTSKIKLKHLKN